MGEAAVALFIQLGFQLAAVLSWRNLIASSLAARSYARLTDDGH